MTREAPVWLTRLVVSVPTSYRKRSVPGITVDLTADQVGGGPGQHHALAVGTDRRRERGAIGGDQAGAGLVAENAHRPGLAVEEVGDVPCAGNRRAGDEIGRAAAKCHITPVAADQRGIAGGIGRGGRGSGGPADQDRGLGLAVVADDVLILGQEIRLDHADNGIEGRGGIDHVTPIRAHRSARCRSPAPGGDGI